jgi:hypothetical protein
MTSPSPAVVKAKLEEAQLATAELADRQVKLFMADLKRAMADCTSPHKLEIEEHVLETGLSLIKKNPTFLPSARGLVNLEAQRSCLAAIDRCDQFANSLHYRARPVTQDRPLKPWPSVRMLLKRAYRRRLGVKPARPNPPFPDEVQS